MTAPHLSWLRTALRAQGSRDARNALADRAGVAQALAARAASGRAVNVDAYLRLCAALCIDPLTGAAKAPAQAVGEINWIVLALAVRGRRYAAGKSIGVRSMAKSIGVSGTTLCRAENGRPISAAALIAICLRLNLHPFDYQRVVQPCVSRETPRPRVPRRARIKTAGATA